MDAPIRIEDVSIRTELRPGDIGYIIYLHGELYKKEYDYGIEFEVYVAQALVEFYEEYNPQKDRVWICEHQNRIVGFLALAHRGKAAQLRFFILVPEFRGLGLGNKLLNLFMVFLQEKKYESCFLWTTNELPASSYLYKKFGFHLTDEKPSKAFGRDVVEQRFELTVTYYEDNR